MGEFMRKCKSSINRALDMSFLNNIANIVLVIVATLLLISMMMSPAILVALALLGLFIWLVMCG